MRQPVEIVKYPVSKIVIMLEAASILGSCGKQTEKGRISSTVFGQNRNSTALDLMNKAGFGKVSHKSCGFGVWAAAGKSLVRQCKEIPMWQKGIPYEFRENRIVGILQESTL